MTTPADPDGSGVPAPNGWGEPPRYGQYAPEQGSGASADPHAAPRYGQSQYGGAAHGGQSAAPGTPPPGMPAAGAVPFRELNKPGIIPLRPLTLGEIYDGAFQALRHNPGVVLGLTTILLAVASTVGVLLSLPLTTIFADWWGQLTDVIGSDPTMTPDDALVFENMTGMVAGSYGVMTGTIVTFTLALPLALAAVAVSVSDSVIDRKVTMGETWSRIGPRWWFLLAIGLLQSFVFLLFLALVIAVVAGLFAVEIWLGTVGVFLGIAACLVFYPWIMVRTLLIAPAIALERGGFWATVVRGWKLTRGVFWRILGIYLLTALIVGFLSQIIATPISMVMSFTMALGDPIVLQIGYGLTMLVTSLFTAIFQGAVVALLYIDTRMRREGLDVQLTAAAADT